MTCSECRAAFKAQSSFETAGLTDAVREHVSSCPDCRRILSALEFVETGGGLHAEPAPELAELISKRILNAPRTRTLKKARLRFGLLSAAAALLLLIGSLVIRPVVLGRRQPTLVQVHLILREPTARSVSVVGDWNSWRPGAQPMRRKDGLWEITLSLKPRADYQYQFLINNDRWIPDPRASLKVANGFGGINSILAT